MWAYLITFLLLVVAVVFLKKPKKVKRKRTAVDAIVLSGPSGAGKGTLIDKLMNEFPDNFAFSVSHTSRAPRAGETNGKEYHFATTARRRRPWRLSTTPARSASLNATCRGHRN
jgi:hypothetical protein